MLECDIASSINPSSREAGVRYRPQQPSGPADAGVRYRLQHHTDLTSIAGSAIPPPSNPPYHPKAGVRYRPRQTTKPADAGVRYRLQHRPTEARKPTEPADAGVRYRLQHQPAVLSDSCGAIPPTAKHLPYLVDAGVRYRL